MSLIALVLSGIVSWYGPGLYGHRTSSGEVLSPKKATCASRTFRNGTILNLMRRAGNNRKYRTQCRVNDYGPAAWTGRVLDITPLVKAGLHMGDLGYVRIESR